MTSAPLLRQLLTGCFMILCACFALQPYTASAQMNDEPYYSMPVTTPINNRFVPERRTACRYAALHVRSCTTTVIKSYPGENKNDSSVTEIVFFHPNGFADSVFHFFNPRQGSYLGRNTGPFKYTKVGGRVVSEMTVDCNSDSLIIKRGTPGSVLKTEHPIYPHTTETRYFDTNGYVCKRKIMAHGLLKHNNSVDGSWNAMYKINISASGNLLTLTGYFSHWWFFRHPDYTYSYRYDANGLVTEEKRVNYTGNKISSVLTTRYSYSFSGS